MLNQETLVRMAENVAAIRRTMAEAARKAGRDAAEIRLCAACKTRTVEEVRASADLAIDLFGENHVQELVEKTDAGAYAGKPGHFIGHLQTNKVNKVVGRAAVIESVDSERLLQKIEAAAARAGLVQDILIEVNIGAETSKSGIAPESLWPLAEAAEAAAHLRLRGLMAIPPADATPERTRRFFAAMRERGLKAATAESCTGGLVAEQLTAVPGASEVFGTGFVTYAAAAKTRLLGVDPALIERCNVVSAPVAAAMARGALAASGADLSVALTGLAGPGGALPGKPVGTVYLAGGDARTGCVHVARLNLCGYGDRAIIRARAALQALDLLRRMALGLAPVNAVTLAPGQQAPEL